MAYSSNFNLDSESFGRSSRSVRDGRSRLRSEGARPDGDARASQRLDAPSMQGAPRTTNRITVSGREPLSSRRPDPDQGRAGRQRSSAPERGSSRSRRLDGASSRPVPARTRSTSDDRRRSQDARAGTPSGARGGRGRDGRRGDFPQGIASTPQRSARPASASDSILAKVFDILKLLVVSIARLIAMVGKAIGHGFLLLWDKSRIAGGAVVLILVLVCGFLIDSAMTQGKIYKGVYVGDVDVAGMTQAQAADAISARYSDKLANTDVYIFTSEEAAKTTDVEAVQMQDEVLAEQVSVEDALENKVLWVESSDTLGARLPAQELAAEAYGFGRTTGLFDRFSTLMHAHAIDVRLDFNETMLSKLVSDLDTAIGNPATETSISIQDGVASVTEGHDGYQIDEGAFRATLTDKLLNSEVDDPRYIPVADYVSLKVSAEAAQRTADALNQALEEGASFAYGDSSADISKETLGSWVTTSAAQRGEEWYLKPELSEQKALETLTESLNLKENGGKYAVSFDVTGDGVEVKPDQEVTIPDVGIALSTLDQSLFGTFCETGTQKVAGERFGISIQTQQTQGPLSLDEALAYGVVTKFSTFTTEFNTGSTTMNRLYNIQKVADLIDDSVVKADGGTWSFNETAGDCNAEAGFKEAGVISGDEMTQEAGGGVCQVATTVFNSVYESGLPINERHNHTLSSSSYPAGRDAAIAYPTLDLIWENSTSSDILLTTSYSSYSVTVDLIGEDPELEVMTETGEWGEGDPYKVKVEVDDTYAPTAVVKMTNGSDGKSINVVRTVKDKDGNLVDQKTFSSVYSPINELYKVGSEVDTAEIQRKNARPDGTSSSSGDPSSPSSSSSSSASSST